MSKEQPTNKIILTLSAQEYGLTVTDLMERYNCKKEDIIVEGEKLRDNKNLN